MGGMKCVCLLMIRMYIVPSLESNLSGRRGMIMFLVVSKGQEAKWRKASSCSVPQNHIYVCTVDLRVQLRLQILRDEIIAYTAQPQDIWQLQIFLEGNKA